MAITAQTSIHTEFGTLAVSYHKIGATELVTFSYGDIRKGIPIVRIHSACLFGEVFHSLHCDCSQQITAAIRMIEKNGNGVIVYTYDEGRGIGLENKIKEMELQRSERISTIEAFKKLGFDSPDQRNFDVCAQVLKDLNVSKTIAVFSCNPGKLKALEQGGFIIKKTFDINTSDLHDLAMKERMFKKEKMGYS